MNQNFRMIDVGSKEITRRRAVATGTIVLNEKILDMIKKKNSPKGDILSMAEVAGLMAAKNTSQLLPLCHPLAIDSIRIWFELGDQSVDSFCEVICHAKTGVEMEALCGVNISLLTIYDLAKAVDPVLEIKNIHLQTKEGGKSGYWHHPKHPTPTHLDTAKDPVTSHFSEIRFAVGTLSDRASRGGYQDESGEILKSYAASRGGQLCFYKIIADDQKELSDLVELACNKNVDLLLLTGGTGISPRDITPDLMSKIADKELIGFGELLRQSGSKFTKSAWLSRSSAYVVQNTLVIIFPGKPIAVQQGLDAVASLIPHALRMIKGSSQHDEPIKK